MNSIAGSTKRFVRCFIQFVVLTSLVGGAWALDLDQTVDFNIPKQKLDSALVQFSEQAKIQITSSSDQVKDFNTDGIVGPYKVSIALKTLLQRSGLSYKPIGQSAISIGKFSAGSAQSTTQSASSGSPDEATSSKEAGKKTSHDFRVAQLDQTSAGPRAIGGDQDSEKKKQEGLAEIIVTGTLIHGLDNRTNPIIVIDRQQIEQSGYSSTQELFQSLPQNYSSGATTQANFLGSGGNNDEFASGVNLRGLGVSSTLVLLNGHRIAPAVTGTQVDVSAIPLAAVERIEILTDGASAIYGSDAVGGVVNIITRKDYEGAETSARYGSVTEGSRKEELLAQTLGSRWSTGNIAGTFQYQNHTALDSRDRDFANAVPSPTDLLPKDHSFGGTLDFRQQLTESVDLYSELFWSKRFYDSNLTSTQAPTNIMVNYNGSSESLDATLGVKYKITPDWSIELNGLYASQDSRTHQIYSGGPYAVANNLYFNAIFDEKSIDVLVNGKVGQTNGGNVGIAVGASYRDEDPVYHFTEDGSPPTNEYPSRNVKAYYGEIYVPVVSDQNSKLFLRALDFSAAIRADRYSDFGSTTNPRLGLLWSPTLGFSFRGSYGTSFRAPTENEIFQGLVPQIYIYTLANPVGPGRVPVIESSAGKPLGPERARTVNVGLEFQPVDLHGVDFVLNYYDIRYKDRIVQVFPPDNALQNPNIYGGLITKFPSGAAAQAYYDAALATGATDYGDVTGTGLTPSDARYAFYNGIENASIVRQSGFDFLASITRDLGVGTLTSQFNASFIDKIDTSYTEGASAANLVSTFGNPTKWRLRFTPAWATKGWELNGAISVVGSYINNAVAGNPPIASWTTVDLGARVHVEQYLSGAEWSGMTLSLSVLNVFDRDPPYVQPGISSRAPITYDPTNANPLKRFVSVELRKKW